MLMIKNHNVNDAKIQLAAEHDVYAVRMVNHHTTFFALQCDREQLDVLTKGKRGQLPSRLPKLLCSHKDPVKEKGFDMTTKHGRKEAMMYFTAMREHVKSRNKKKNE